MGGGGCTLRAGVAAKGVCRWFVSEDEINSAVGFIAARRKRPRRKGTNVNKFKSDLCVGPTVSGKTLPPRPPPLPSRSNHASSSFATVFADVFVLSRVSPVRETALYAASVSRTDSRKRMGNISKFYGRCCAKL